MSWFEAADPLLPDIIRLNAEWRGRHPAVRCDGQSLDWRQLGASVNRVANALSALDLVPGDRVAILMQNSIDMLAAMLGAVCGGFVAVPLNVSVADDGIEKQIIDCEAKAIIASPEHAGRIDGMRARLPAAIGARTISAPEPRAGWLHLAELMQAASPLAPELRIAPGDACNIIYSSGTTGLPKGIVHTHACRMAWAYDMSVALRYHADARTLMSLGLYSNISWVTMLNTILCGGTLILMPRFDIRSCLELIERERISHAGMVPVQFQRLLESAEFPRHDLASLESLMCCGSPLHAELKKSIVARIPGDFIELYGLTEGLVTIQSPQDAALWPASVGKPCPGQYLRILDDDDRPLPAGEAGEIVGYGRLLMSGYLNRDEENACSTWTDAAGRRWLRTGDIGRVDDDGNLYLVDRKKDMIISGGQNIYPADIEAVIATHPKVSEVAVIGVGSERWGETPLAVVCGKGIEPADLMRWANDRLGRQQRLAGVQLIDELPRNPNGKVLKRELRKRFADVTAEGGAG
jgi:acyl-CoA synthetase (AMP-forming)/AMP-acid ligase II